MKKNSHISVPITTISTDKQDTAQLDLQSMSEEDLQLLKKHGNDNGL